MLDTCGLVQDWVLRRRFGFIPLVSHHTRGHNLIGRPHPARAGKQVLRRHFAGQLIHLPRNLIKTGHSGQKIKRRAETKDKRQPGP